MPANSPSTPPPTSRPIAAPLTPLEKIPNEIAASEAARTPMPALAECPASRDCGRVAPSRTAAIGGTRVARRAGMMLASSVIPVPSSSETMIVRPAMTVVAFGSSTPIAPNSAMRPFAIAMPNTSPITEATNPITSPSSRTERMTCLREAPRVRSVAYSRVRWATVMDSVLKITNAPTSRAMKPKASRKSLIVRSPSLRLSASSFACALLSLTSRFAPRSGLTARTTAAGELPFFAASDTES